MRKRNKGNEFTCGGLFHFPITVSLRGKGHMDWRAFLYSNYCLATRKRKHGSHECIFAFVNVLYEEHKKQTRQADTNPIYASRLLLIGILTNDCLIVYLFFQLNDTKRKNKRRHKQEILLFCFHFFTLRIEINETMYNGSYLYFPFFVYELGKRKMNTNLPFSIFYYGFGKRKTKGRYIQHNVLFRFSFYHLAKEKTKICITDPISIFRFLFVD